MPSLQGFTQTISTLIYLKQLGCELKNRKTNTILFIMFIGALAVASRGCHGAPNSFISANCAFALHPLVSTELSLPPLMFQRFARLQT